MAYAMSGDFVLGDKSLIHIKTLQKVNAIGTELRAKTNTSLYISITNSSLDSNIKEHSKKISQKINNFYKNKSILIAIALDIEKMDIISTSNVANLIDEDKILNTYVIPFFVGHDKNSIISKHSAGVLNGYSQLAEDIADNKNIILENAIYSESKDFFDVFRILIYLIFFVIAILYIYNKIKKD
jgi:uncharacterized membrane protein YgcG